MKTFSIKRIEELSKGFSEDNSKISYYKTFSGLTPESGDRIPNIGQSCQIIRYIGQSTSKSGLQQLMEDPKLIKEYTEKTLDAYKPGTVGYVSWAEVTIDMEEGTWTKCYIVTTRDDQKILGILKKSLLE